MPNLNYAMMSKCERIGIAGNCGIECPVFLDLECEEPEELLEILIQENLKEE
jgi:hypothetical protein